MLLSLFFINPFSKFQDYYRIFKMWYLMNHDLFFFVFFWGRVSACNAGWPCAQFVVQADLEPCNNSPASASESTFKSTKQNVPGCMLYDTSFQSCILKTQQTQKVHNPFLSDVLAETSLVWPSPLYVTVMKIHYYLCHYI